MTLLQLINKFCDIAGLPRTSSVISSTDPQIIQIKELLEEELLDLGSRHKWQALNTIVEFQSILSENQGKIATIANGFEYLVNDTFWDTESQLPVIGPLNSQQWQAMKAAEISGPDYVYRIVGGDLLIYPAPSSVVTFRFEAMTNSPIRDPSQTTAQTVFLTDNDVVVLSERLILLGLRWRWKREKGLDYAELFNMYEFQVKDAMGRDGGAPVLSMQGLSKPNRGVFIPIGDWLS